MELMKLVAIPTVSHTHLIEVNTMSTMQYIYCFLAKAMFPDTTYARLCGACLFLFFSSSRKDLLKEIFLFIYFLLINVVVYSVCSHCALHASVVQFILDVRVLLFIFISFILSCMTYMKIIGSDCNK